MFSTRGSADRRSNGQASLDQGERRHDVDLEDPRNASAG